MCIRDSISTVGFNTSTVDNNTILHDFPIVATGGARSFRQYLFGRPDGVGTTSTAIGGGGGRRKRSGSDVCCTENGLGRALLVGEDVCRGQGKLYSLVMLQPSSKRCSIEL